MTKPTITDEDRAAAEITQEDRYAYDSLMEDPCYDDPQFAPEHFARHRIAAFNAGLERAAELVVGYIHPDPDRLPGELFASAAIRAEKEKP